MCRASDSAKAHTRLVPLLVTRPVKHLLGYCRYRLHRCRACGARVWVSGEVRLTVAEAKKADREHL